MSEITNAQIEEFHDDPETVDITERIFTPRCNLQAQSNGKVVRLYDMGGWNEYYPHEDLLERLDSVGKIRLDSDLRKIDDLELEQTEEFQ